MECLVDADVFGKRWRCLEEAEEFGIGEGFDIGGGVWFRQRCLFKGGSVW